MTRANESYRVDGVLPVALSIEFGLNELPCTGAFTDG
jgi:hypothetical protein